MKFLRVSAMVASTLIALLLKGSSAGSYPQSAQIAPAAMHDQIARAVTLYWKGDFREARDLFRAIASYSQRVGAERSAAMNWNNAGGCSVFLRQYGAALTDFARAKKVAEASGQTAALAGTLNNLANLYLHTDQPENAIRVAAQGLKLSPDGVAPGVRAKTRFQMACALMMLKRYDEAQPMYLQSVNELLDRDDLDTASRELGLLGTELVKGNRLDEAEWALSEGLRLTRVHRLAGAANILRELGQLRSAQGNLPAAASFFDAAVASPPGLTPRWEIFTDRGEFRLKQGDLPGALADFREGRRMAFQLRADMVPADEDRVALEGGLGTVMEGFVDAGNQVVRRTGDQRLLEETFDAAEQDRLWSLRALLPSADDWRTRLPEHYWELLSRYQALELASVKGDSPEIDKKAAPLRFEMQQIEAAAAGSESLPEDGISPLLHVQQTLDADSVLLSFHVTKTSSWIWAVDKEHTAVFPLPPLAVLREQVSQFADAVRDGKPAKDSGRRLFLSLFGQVGDSWLAHRHWLLEPDGPLYELPFAALVAGESSDGQPVYLIERAALQTIPSALLMERGSVRMDGKFLGVGDPVYNMADPRFAGGGAKPELTLPRLPNSSRELKACLRAWNPAPSQLLEGNSARIDLVRTALRDNPAIIHFATHIVSSGGDFRSGLIALSLGANGAMGLLGPKEIVARPVGGSLVVMDGCYSSRGEALPGAGLMGLTRAWIGAGARAVMATQWDVPDEASQSIMTNFYRSLSGNAGSGLASALREAQIAELRRDDGRQNPGKWAGYFLLSRM